MIGTKVFDRRLVEAYKVISLSFIGLVIGGVPMALVSICVDIDFLPANSIFIFGIVCLIAQLATINRWYYLGMFHAIGWLVVAIPFFMTGFFGTLDVIFNMGGPAIIIILRLIFWIKATRE